MRFRRAKLRTQPSGPLEHIRGLWQCLALPAVLVLATLVVLPGSTGAVSAGNVQLSGRAVRETHGDK